MVGPAEQSFALAIDRAVGTSPNRHYTLLVVPENLGDDALTIDEKVTLGQVSDAFSNQLLSVDNAGRGGGGEPIALLFDVLNEFLSGIRTVVTIGDAIGAVRWRKYRAEAKEWDDSGKIPAELVDLLVNHGEWIENHFEQAFKLPRHRGTKLLRKCGYDRRRDEQFGTIWFRRWPEREPKTAPHRELR